MVPVKEDERLLAEDNEHGVDELRNLRQNEHLSCKPSGTTGKCTVDMFANSVFKGVVGDAIEHVRDCTEGSPSREEGEEQVPSSERSLEIKGWTVGHDLLTEITEEKVSNDRESWKDIMVLGHPIEDGHSVEGFFKVRIKQ